MAGVTTTHPASSRTHGKAGLMFLEEDLYEDRDILLLKVL